MRRSSNGMPVEHLISLGQINVNFALLEQALKAFIERMIGRDHMIGQIVSAELSFKGLVSLTASLYKYRIHDSKKVEDLRKLLGQVLQAEEQRNLIVHSSWGMTTSDDTPPKTTVHRGRLTARLKKGYHYQHEEMSADDLDKIAELLLDIQQEVMKFMIQDFSEQFNG